MASAVGGLVLQPPDPPCTLPSGVSPCRAPVRPVRQRTVRCVL